MKCKICGKEFTPSKESRTICSDVCRVISKRASVMRYSKKKSQEKQLMLGTRCCEVCGKEFHPRTSLMVRCSPECTAKLGSLYTLENKKLRRKLAVEKKNLKKGKEAELVEFTAQAWQEGRRSYGKHEMQGYLEQQSLEMAKRRRELDAEWERKRKMTDERTVHEGFKR